VLQATDNGEGPNGSIFLFPKTPMIQYSDDEVRLTEEFIAFILRPPGKKKKLKSPPAKTK
jgi:hypothetical protein